ncbi:regulatory protein NosR, partial [Weissella cibaria]|nr:regulatory protein NosR [Weissella cibaria]
LTAEKKDVSEKVVLKDGPVETRSWEDLVGDGSVRRMSLTVGEVTRAFEQSGQMAAAQNVEDPDPNASFIDLYVAQVSVPTIGKSLLGEREYRNLQKRLKDGQQAFLVMGSGLYSFKGSGYVRGGVFDRLQLVQGDRSVRFRDRHHKRLSDVK